MALSYPKRLRTPTQRKGALSYEIRVRVPGEARGEKFKGTHTTRSLGTRDKAQALRNVPKTYDGLHAEFDAEADRLRGAMPAAPILSVAEVCRIQSENLLAGEEKYRREFVAGYQGDPVALARNHRARLRRQLAQYQALAANRDYANGEWLLTWLSKSGQGDVVNRDAALRALARNAVRVIREIIADDMAVSADDDPVIDDDTPTLSAHAEAYLDRRARELTEERAAMFRAVVRDFIDLVGADRPVSDYTKSDAMKFMDALACLPANWTKDRRLRALSIGDAAVEAKSKSLPVQSAQSIRKKVALIKAVFADAKDRYEDVDITFPTRTLPKRGAANDARDPFTDQELKTLLGSAPPGHLYWLTWLGLCTGARLNELAQLTDQHIRQHDDISYICFDESLRLKTPACVRSIPIHRKLIERDFLGYVASRKGLLFPGIAQHSSGRFSDALSKAFRRHLVALGIKRPKLSFHSLRHNFADRFKVDASSEVETRERLLGHDVPGVAGRYGSSYKAEANDLSLLTKRAAIIDVLKF